MNLPTEKKKRRPFWIILASLCLVSIVALLAFGLRQNGFISRISRIEVRGAPAVKVDQEVIDYGEVKNGLASIKTVVQVTNVGDQELIFTDAPHVQVLEGCCPPGPAIGAMSLRPGESTTISMEFFMHDFMGGMHKFSLHIFTNDPVQPVKTVTILSNWVD